MARITLNVAQESVDGASFDPIPEGKYTATVFEIKPQECKSAANKGKPQLNVQFKISDGQPSANRRVFKLLNLFGDNPFDAIGFFKALGVEYNNGQFDVDTDDLLGESLQITIKHTERLGKDEDGRYTVSSNPKEYREEVKGYRSLDSVDASAKASATPASGTKGKFSLV